MKLYGFVGRAGSGKDTCATLLKNKLTFSLHCDPHEIIQLSFAGPLKRDLANMLQIDETYFHDRVLKESPVPGYEQHTPRSLMTWYGTLMKQKFGNDFWIRRMAQEINIRKHSSKCIMITDVRFVDEMEFIRSRGGEIIYMDRDKVLHPIDTDTAHISELSVYACLKRCQDDSFDYIHIDNNWNSTQKLENEIHDKIMI